MFAWLTDANKVVVLKDTYSNGYMKGTLSALQTDIFFPIFQKVDCIIDMKALHHNADKPGF